MGAAGANRRRALALLLATAAVGLLVAALGIVSAGAIAPDPENPKERELLRLHDLPAGYSSFDQGPEGTGIELFCEDLALNHAGQRPQRYVERFQPEGCLGFYLRAYRVPGGTPAPAIVGTGVLGDPGAEHFLSPEREAGAHAGFALADEILGAAIERGLREVPAIESVGEATRLFHWRRVPTVFPESLFHNPHRGSFLVWRWRATVAVTFAVADSLAASDRMVAELARRQQAHIEAPTVYTEAERDTSEVLLEDPALTFPVYWLGREFAPGHGLPPARLLVGGSTKYMGLDAPHQKLALYYDHGIRLASWTARGWERFAATAKGHRLLRRARHCAESTDLSIRGGNATLFAGYGRDLDACPKHPPERHFALIRLGGTVTTVNLGCRGCWFNSPYNSLDGIRAIVRSLSLRPRAPAHPLPAD